jgi:hypothetical protein
VKRVGRWAFKILAGISLALCVLTVLLWVRSYFTWDYLFVHGGRRQALALYGASYPGGFFFGQVSKRPWPPEETPFVERGSLALPRDGRWDLSARARFTKAEFAGVAWMQGNGGSWLVAVPFWLSDGAFAVVSAICLSRNLRFRRRIGRHGFDVRVCDRRHGDAFSVDSANPEGPAAR